MPIKLSYDPKQDRIILQIPVDSETHRAFWLQRNQCLAMLARLTNILEQMGMPTTPPVAQGLQPAARPKADTDAAALQAESLSGIKIRPEGDSVRISFLHPQHTAAVGFKGAGLQKLHEALALQAERAGWDPAAGLERIKAMAQARQAISRSSA